MIVREDMVRGTFSELEPPNVNYMLDHICPYLAGKADVGGRRSGAKQIRQL